MLELIYPRCLDDLHNARSALVAAPAPSTGLNSMLELIYRYRWESLFKAYRIMLAAAVLRLGGSVSSTLATSEFCAKRTVFRSQQPVYAKS